MRLPIIPPSNLNAEQKPLYDDMRRGIAANFQGFINVGLRIVCARNRR